MILSDIENQECWIFNYKPTLKNLIYPDFFISKLKSFIKDKTIPLNLMLIGNSGYGKLTLLRCILKECFNIEIEQFKPHYKFQHILTFETFFFIDFMYYKNSDFKDIVLFIKSTASKTFIQFNENPTPKLIIFKNIHMLSNNYITSLTAVIKSTLDNCLFICLSNLFIQSLTPYFTIFRIPYLDEKVFKTNINKILKKNKIVLKNTNLTHPKMYKTYKDTFYNFKNTLLWIQYQTTNDGKKSKSMMPIKKKMIASLLNFILSETHKMNSKKEIKHLEQVDNYIVGLIGCGIEPKEILKYSLNMLLNMKMIEPNKKLEIIKMISTADKELLNVDKKYFPLKKMFINLAILFK